MSDIMDGMGGKYQRDLYDFHIEHTTLDKLRSIHQEITAYRNESKLLQEIQTEALAILNTIQAMQLEGKTA